MEGGESLPPPQPVPEIGRSIERQYKREDILSVFSESFTAFESYPAEKLSPRQQESIDLIREIKSKTLDQNKLSYLNTIPNGKGKPFRQKEYLPVEELKIFLNQRVESGELSPEETAQYQRWSEVLGTAQPYDRTKQKREPQRWTARARQEIERIKRYPNLVKLIEQEGAEKGKSVEESLLNEAERRLLERRELIVPGEEKSPDEHEEYNIDIISAQEAVDKKAHDRATKDVTDQIKNNRFYEFWHWPRKIGLRLVEGGAINIQTDRLRQANIRNNTSFCGTNLAETAAKGVNERSQILERFKKDQTLSREQKIEAEGALKQVVVNELLCPITDGTVTNADQVRVTLATFVRNHLNDADPAVRAQIESLFGPRASDFGNLAEYFATDILEMGLRIKEGMQKHNESLAQFDQYIHINLGLAREAANTDTRSITDRAVAWARQRQNESLARGARGVGFSGIILNPAVVGVGVALGAQGILRSVGWTAKAAAVPSFIAGGVGGAAIAGARRYVELGKDRQTHLAERAMGETLQQQHANTGLGRLFERMAGGYRREDLENYRYDSVTVDQLINGQGQEIVAGGGIRKSITELTDPASVATNQAEIARRVAEIDIRLNRGQSERTDWIQYTSRDNINWEVSQLFEARDKLRAALTDPTLENTWAQSWNRALTQDHRDKDIGFRNYRLRNAAGATIFGGVAGAVGGLVGQEAVAVGRRIAGETVGKTVLENIWEDKPSSEWFSGAGAAGLSIDQARDLYTHPRNLEIAQDLIFRTFRKEDGTVTADFVDALGKKLSDQPIHVLENGHLVVSGSVDTLPDKIKSFVGSNEWQRQPYNNPDFNLHQKIQGIVDTKGHEIFTHGDTVISIDAEKGTASMLDVPTKNELYGTINPDGSLAFKSWQGDISNLNVDWKEMQSRLNSEGWGIAVTPETPPAPPLQKILETQPPQNIIEYFEKHPEVGEVKKALRDYWHENDTPIRRLQDGRVIGVDGKELQFDHRVIPGADITPRTIQLDFSQMKSQLIPDTSKGINWDQSIDSQYNRLVKDIISQPDGSNTYKDFEILITPDKAADDARQVIILKGADHPELAKGLLNLKADSPEAKAFFNLDEEGNPIINKYDNFQKAAFIEVAHNEKDSAGNIIKRTILSTTEGPGTDTITPPPIERTSVKGPPLSYDVYTFDPPQAVELTPSLPETPPIVPIPFTPRHPLEPLTPPPPPPPVPPWEYFGYPQEYGLGYSTTGKDSVEQYINWLKHNGYMPKRTAYHKVANGKWVNADGSEIVRNISAERQHISEYLASQNPEHLKMIRSYTKRLPPMREECRVAVLIPAYLEGKNIYHTLSEWANQTNAHNEKIDPKTYEIDIIVNGPTGYKQDDTILEIERFKRDYPDIGVNYINLQIPQKGGNVGLTRKIIADIILQRSINRPSQSEPLYIESEDADLLEIDRKAIHRVIESLDQKPYIDALRGKQDLAPQILMGNDYLFFERRAERLMEYLMRDYRLSPDRNENYDFYWNRNITGGWNTAFTADAYAMIGGYQPARVGEDVDIGRRISVMRGSINNKGVFVPNVNTIERVHNTGQSNPRRFIHASIRRMPTYADFTNEQINYEIRNMTLDEMMSKLDFGKRINSSNIGDFEEVLTKTRQFMGWKISDSATQEKLFSRLMLALGFAKYKIVTNADGSQSIINGSLSQTGVDKDEWKMDYHIEPDGKVKIDSISNIQKALEEYRQKHSSSPAVTVTPPETPTPPPDTATNPAVILPIPATPEKPTLMEPVELQLTDTQPEAVLKQLNKTLNNSKTDRQQIVLGVKELVNYIQKIKLPNNAKIINPHYSYTPEGNLVISANASASKAFLTINTSFSAELANNPSGGMRVVKYNVGDLGFAEFLRGKIENVIGNLNEQIKFAVSEQTPGWQVDNFRITPEQKLAFDFQKK